MKASLQSNRWQRQSVFIDTRNSEATGMRRAYQLAPEGTFMSVHAAGTQYEEAEKTQYGSPMAAWRSPVVTLYLAESASHPVPLVGMVMPFRSAAQIV